MTLTLHKDIIKMVKIKITKNESLGHILGKELAINKLRKLGFKEHLIMPEFPIILQTGKKRIIDAVGIDLNSRKKIAYEVGVLNGGSIEELYSLFDEVKRIEKINIEDKRLKDILQYLYDEIDFWKEKFYSELNEEHSLLIRNARLYGWRYLLDKDLSFDEVELSFLANEIFDLIYEKPSGFFSYYKEAIKEIKDYLRREIIKEINLTFENIKSYPKNTVSGIKMDQEMGNELYEQISKNVED